MDKTSWESRAEKLARSHPLKIVKHAPAVPGITKDTAKGLRWKALKYLIRHDHQRLFLRYFFKRPFRYGLKLLKSYFRKKTYVRDDDFFLYGLKNTAEFEVLLKDPRTVFVSGFSYCHKPLECPSGRFTDQCAADSASPVCGQCFIGKVQHLTKVKPWIIPTIHYIGEKMFEAVEKNRNKQVVFLISACELTLEMFGDWGNMLGAKGIGVRLDGRICNTMKAFELSEVGIKPGLTTVLPKTQERILSVLLSRPSTLCEKA